MEFVPMIHHADKVDLMDGTACTMLESLTKNGKEMEPCTVEMLTNAIS